MEKARFYNPRTGETEEIDVEYYAGEFSERDFWSKIKSKIKSAGLQLIYKAMQLYYATENPNCPTKVKAGIYAALGYFVAPLDFLPGLHRRRGQGEGKAEARRHLRAQGD